MNYYTRLRKTNTAQPAPTIVRAQRSADTIRIRTLNAHARLETPGGQNNSALCTRAERLASGWSDEIARRPEWGGARARAKGGDRASHAVISKCPEARARAAAATPPLPQGAQESKEDGGPQMREATQLHCAPARLSMPALPIALSLVATTYSVETVLSACPHTQNMRCVFRLDLEKWPVLRASVTERVPRADDLRPEKGR